MSMKASQHAMTQRGRKGQASHRRQFIQHAKVLLIEQLTFERLRMKACKRKEPLGQSQTMVKVEQNIKVYELPDLHKQTHNFNAC